MQTTADALTRLLLPDDPLLRPVTLAGNQFPGIWTAMMPKGLFELKFPAERRATCMNCPKACYDGFRADYRCCTYHPRVSNFLLGLASETAAGRGALQRLIDRGMLLPEGMYSTPGQWIDFLDDQKHDAFGRSTEVLCPMLDAATGYCDIHAFRNAVCSTFFCLSDHGKAGEAFWVQVQTLGSQLELILAQWALKEVGFDLDRYFQAFDSLAPRIREVSTPIGWQPAVVKELWGDWAGREVELMRATAAVIVRQRERLWELAKDGKIRESIPFDRAMDTLLPEDLEGEVEDIDLDEGSAENMQPEATWKEALEAHARLWAWPAGKLRLSPNASYRANPKRSAEEQFYADQAGFIEYRFGANQAPEWTLAVSKLERELVASFQTPQTLEEALQNEKFAAGVMPHREVFLTEMLNKKVLWPSN